jgi:hypothetical protein
LLNNLGLSASDQGDQRAAAGLFTEALCSSIDSTRRSLGRRLVAGRPGPGPPRRDEIDRALRLWSSAARLHDEVDAPLPPYQGDLLDKHVAAARAAIATSTELDFDRVWQAGRAMTLDEAERTRWKRRSELARSQEVGWLMGLEPTTTGITILDSTN